MDELYGQQQLQRVQILFGVHVIVVVVIAVVVEIEMKVGRMLEIQKVGEGMKGEDEVDQDMEVILRKILSTLGKI